MNLKEYAKILNELITANPECVDMQVVACIDDEGNGFDLVHYGPSLGKYDGEYRGEFTPESQFEEMEEESGCKPYQVNAICLN